jgi:hypothetical protein
MQKQSKSRIYKKLLFGSLSLFILGILVALTNLLGIYGTVNKCGFGAGNCTNPSIHSGVAKVGSYIAVAGFYVSIVFAILFCVARSKEK